MKVKQFAVILVCVVSIIIGFVFFRISSSSLGEDYKEDSPIVRGKVVDIDDYIDLAFTVYYDVTIDLGKVADIDDYIYDTGTKASGKDGEIVCTTKSDVSEYSEGDSIVMYTGDASRFWRLVTRESLVKSNIFKVLGYVFLLCLPLVMIIVMVLQYKRKSSDKESAT